MTDPNRDAIISRIQKLRKMTEANGASENEAQTAISMIAKLMADYGIHETETQLRADAQGMITDYIILWQTAIDEWNLLPTAISKLYHTKPYYQRGAEDILEIGEMTSCTYIKFFGYPIDVAASVATMQLCATATNVESMAFRGKPIDKYSFRLGMITRLRERIQEITTQRDAAAPTGTGLMVIKDALVREEFARVGPRLGRTDIRNRTVNQSAMAAGRAAGNRVDLAQRTKVPDGGYTSPRRIA